MSQHEVKPKTCPCPHHKFGMGNYATVNFVVVDIRKVRSTAKYNSDNSCVSTRCKKIYTGCLKSSGSN